MNSMDITNIHVELQNDGPVLAYITVNFNNCFVIKDIRMLQSGLISMPSRKHKYRCDTCNNNVYYLSNYCSSCGTKQENIKIPEKIHSDVCHPITSEFRTLLADAITTAVQNKIANRSNQS